MLTIHDTRPILVLGGTGKTGRRLVERLQRNDTPVRVGSRGGKPPFDWTDPATWAPALDGTARRLHRLPARHRGPRRPRHRQALIDTALARGVRRLVLLSGRGEEEAQRAEAALIASGADWTILRASWFAQNFSESFFRDAILEGELALPAGDVGEPFVDVDDIADAAFAALTDDRHVGRSTSSPARACSPSPTPTAEIARATGRPVAFRTVTPEDYTATLTATASPPTSSGS